MRRKISQLLHSANSVRQATGILVVTAAVSNVLGLVRNTVIAKNIPLGLQDNFWSAFVLPDIIFNVLIFGAISSAFIPLFRGLLVKKDEETAWQMAGSFLVRMTALVVILAAVLFVTMPGLVHLIFPSIAADSTHEVILLSRILLLQTILMGWSYIIGGILNAKQRFVAYSLSPILYNTAIIVGALLAPYSHGHAVTVLIWSVVAGAVLHLLIQIPSVIALGFRWRYLNIRPNEFSREILLLMTPRSIALGITSINTVLFAAIARNLMLPGALSIYRLVESFQTAPIAIFANAVAVALFPTLTEHASREDWKQFSASLVKAIRFILFTLIPSTVLFIVLRAQIIRLYIGLGPSTDWSETIRAINVFGWFAIGMLPAGLVSVFARSFYALKNTVIPMFAAAFTLVFGATTAYFLASTTSLDATGLAIATTAAAMVQAILLYLAYIRIVRHALPEQEITATALWTMVASLGMGEAMWLTLKGVDWLYIHTATTLSTRTILGLFIQTGTALIVGLIVFAGIATLFLKEEIQWLKSRRKLT